MKKVINKGKGSRTLPSRGAVNDLLKGPGTITNYAKAVPDTVADDRVALVTQHLARKGR